jgi:hypothetical protein
VLRSRIFLGNIVAAAPADVVACFPDYYDESEYLDAEPTEDSATCLIFDAAPAVAVDYIPPTLEAEDEPADEGEDSWTPQLFDPWTPVGAITAVDSGELDEEEEVFECWCSVIFDDAPPPPVLDYSACYWVED